MTDFLRGEKILLVLYCVEGNNDFENLQFMYF